MRKLLLRHFIEDIALILRRIQRFFQYVASRFVRDAGIVPRRDVVAAEQPRAFQQAGELKISVAVDAGVRRQAVAVAFGKAADHDLAELVGEVKYVKRHF